MEFETDDMLSWEEMLERTTLTLVDPHDLDFAKMINLVEFNGVNYNPAQVFVAPNLETVSLMYEPDAEGWVDPVDYDGPIPKSLRLLSTNCQLSDRFELAVDRCDHLVHDIRTTF